MNSLQVETYYTRDGGTSQYPVVSVAFAIKRLGVSKPTAGRAVEALEKAGVLVETAAQKRDRSWVYRRYLDKLRAGTELETPGSTGSPR